jgi:hypothetical protein
MAIPSEAFEVVFAQKRGEQFHPIKVKNYFKGELDFYEKQLDDYVEITENLDLTIQFTSSDMNARLYMDGLETLPERLLENDPLEGEPYLTPTGQTITLFSNTEECYPLIPGFYRIAVECEGQRFYSWIKVIPKQLEQTQWEIMRDEVEKELSGLARDIVLRRNGLDSAIGGIPQSLLGQFIVIKNRFPSFMAALSDLYRKVNYKISKNYVLVPKEKSRRIDEKTIRHRVSHPENEQALKTPVSTINYDLPENRLAKKIVLSVSKTLAGFIQAVESMERILHATDDFRDFRSDTEKERTLSELEKLGEMAGKMRGAILWIETAPWYEAVGSYNSSALPHVMNSDPRYRAIYQLYRELKSEQIKTVMDKSFSYQWKRTDKLYEIWGFIQFMKALSNSDLGFIPERGWVYNENFEDNRLLVPVLPPNTEVVFQKDDIRIKLIYEALLPTASKSTSPTNPIYTRSTHTCPDGRIDVYQKDVFIGTIIFDFKYRPRSAVWNQSLISSNRQSGVMRQLVSYGDNLHSPYLFGEGSNPFVSHLSPVQEVWALYPNRYGTERNHEFPDHKLSLLELTPGVESSVLVGKIKEAIERLLERSERFIKML